MNTNLQLAAHLPLDRARALADQTDLPTRTAGAVLFADLSGFTAHGAALVTEHGARRGAEELVMRVNAIYDGLIDIMHRYGGSVVGFGGDALTVWFDGDSGLHAIACALTLQDAMHRLHIPGLSSAFALKVAISAGAVGRWAVGSPSVRRFDVLAGATINRAAIGERLAREHEVLVDEVVATRHADKLTITTWRTAESGHRYARVQALQGTFGTNAAPDLPTLSAEVARPWLNAPVYQRLQHVTDSTDFLTELRLAVALFIQLKDLDYDNDPQAGIELDASIRIVQSVLERYGGELLEIVMGDKGGYLYAAFGVPSGHEDDPARALSAAFALQASADQAPALQGTSIGIARGQMHCGVYGGRQRRTYSALGNDVNLAARLMSKARPGEILVSERIARAHVPHATFTPRGVVPVKGHPQPVAIFHAQATGTHTLTPHPISEMVGRETARASMYARLDALATGAGGAVLIEGEAGIGKSVFLHMIQQKAQENDYACLLSAAHAIEESTPYYAWRQLVAGALGLPNTVLDITFADRTAPRAQTAARIATLGPEWVPLTPLLNTLIPLDLPENDFTRQLAGATRAANLHRLIVAILGDLLRAHPLVLIIDDAHWLDAASWDLLETLRHELPALLFVIATRPQGTQPAQGYTTLVQAANTLLVVLEPLPHEDVHTLLCHRLGATALAPDLSTFIAERAEGHPFFSEEIAYALRDRGLLSMSLGVCQLATHAGGGHMLEFPDTIEGVITSRIDLLGPTEQRAVKVGSVIGRVFLYQTLHDIHPVEEDRLHLRHALTRLEKLDLTRLDAPDPHLAYFFKHIITQQVAYSLLPSSQRHGLHRVIAQWFMRAHSDNLAPHYPLLAHHWHAAGDLHEAMQWYARAGTQALHAFANQAAVTFFELALALDTQTGQRTAQTVRAQWELQLGEAYAHWAKYREARTHIETGLALLGHPVPTETSAFVQAMGREIARQTWRRIGPPARPVALTAEAQNTVQLVSAVGPRLAEIYYFLGETPRSIYINLYGLNLAEEIGTPPHTAEHYASFAIACAYAGLHQASWHYTRMAENLLPRITDPVLEATVVMVLSSFYYGAGQWEEATRGVARLEALSRHLGNQRRLNDALSIAGYMARRRHELPEVQRIALALGTPSNRRDYPKFYAEAQFTSGWLALETHDYAAGIAQLEAVQAQLAAAGSFANIPMQIELHGWLARAYLRHGDDALALKHAARAVTLTPDLAAVSLFNFAGYVAPAALYLTLWQRGDTRWRTPARHACANLRRYAGVLPMAAPIAAYYTGWLQHLAHAPRLARDTWRAGLATATRLNLPFDAARLQAALTTDATHLPTG